MLLLPVSNMNQLEYYEEDVIRILDLGDEKVYVFSFAGDVDQVVTMFDEDSAGEMPEDFSVYVDSVNEICYRFSYYQEPIYPIVVKYFED